jgi:GTPase SAR1 family protein
MSEFELPILPYTALIIGNRACGKTSLVNDLLTKSSVNNYLAVVPFLSHNMCYQKQIVSIKPDQYLWNGGQTIVLDNCILSSSQWKSNAFRKAITVNTRLL